MVLVTATQVDKDNFTFYRGPYCFQAPLLFSTDPATGPSYRYEDHPDTILR